MSDALPFSELVLPTLRQIVDGQARIETQIETRLGAIETRLAAIESRQEAIEARLEAVEARLEAIEARLEAVEARLEAVEAGLATLDGRVGLLETRMALLETGLDQTRLELLKLRVDVMDRLDRFQTMLENVRESTAVTLMMDQRVTKKLKETDQDRDDLFEQMMAIERQLMTLSLRIDAIEDQRH